MLTYCRLKIRFSKTRWGIYDVEDCCSGALHLAREGKVDSSKLAITGRSAGGYTVLAVLTFRNIFRTGKNISGNRIRVSNQNQYHLMNH